MLYIIIFMIVFFVSILSLEMVPKDMTVRGFIEEKLGMGNNDPIATGKEYLKTDE